MPKYDKAIFIGRFQPFHNEHLHVIKQGFNYANEVIVAVGSSRGPRTIRNPFTFAERLDMIAAGVASLNQDVSLSVVPLPDHMYDDNEWIKGVQDVVDRHTGNSVALLGCHKDKGTSYYLKMFPQWESINVPQRSELSATQLRAEIFSMLRNPLNINKIDVNSMTGTRLARNMPLASFSKMVNIINYYRWDWDNLLQEYDFIEKYKQQWEASPYPPTFVCVDAAVIQSGNILLVQRGAMPGKGLWALPGGFLDQGERIQDAIFRELKEETAIDVPLKVLKGSLKHIRVFDDPNRSLRGRTITHCGLIELENAIKLPKIKGGDDAAKAKWWPLNRVTESMMYDDHYHIIQAMR